MVLLGIFLVSISNVFASLLADSVVAKNTLFSERVQNLKLQKCSQSTSYPLTVSDVQIQLTNKWGLIVNGTLKSQVNLDKDIEAAVDLKRYEVLWIPVPCMHGVGSCTYEDLCIFGVSSNKTCPKDFVQQRVPCRCPVRKGTYTLHMKTESLLGRITSVYSGSYKGNVIVKHKGTLLSCYNFSFDLADAVEDSLQPSVVMV